MTSGFPGRGGQDARPLGRPGKGVGKSKSLFHASRSMAVQTEVNLIAETLRLNALEGTPPPQTEEEFADFLRHNLKLPDNVNRGPDKTLNTADDVIAEVAL